MDNTKQIKVIVTGATGMIGEGVLLECLQNKNVQEVLMVNRKHFNFSHPKLKELIVPDFFKIENFAQQLNNYDACFYCAGVSSVGMNEDEYTKITYHTTLHFANIVKQQNAGIVFNFVSGAHTDSAEKGRTMWARVKGKTENALIKLFDKKEYNFRPALMKPIDGQKNFYGYNRITHKKLYGVLSLFFPSCTIQQIAQAMINASIYGFDKNILEVKDIKTLAKKL